MKLDIERYLKGTKICAIVCNQWGDTGKGKFAHLFGPYFDVIARGTGGANAGHTVKINGKEYIQHLLPTAVLLNDPNKIILLGNGMVLDPELLCFEINDLVKEGIDRYELIISDQAHVVMPYHKELDQLKNQSQARGGIGSTGKGIGPCYADKVARKGIMMRDLYKPDVLKKKLIAFKEYYKYSCLEKEIDIDVTMNYLRPFAKQLEPFIDNTISRIHEFVNQKKKILIEGAQGLLLSYEFGTYPYVTSSDCSINGTAAGVGLSALMVDNCYGIVKFPMMTRVGGGPFPTEIGAAGYQQYCAFNSDYKVRLELTNNNIPFKVVGKQVHYDRNHPTITKLMNAKTPFKQQMGIRLKTGEFGATSGRPRRIGWTDMVAARYAVNVNGPKVILTKLDSLAGIKSFKLCHAYKIGDTTIDYFPTDPVLLNQVTPDYYEYNKGYDDISDIDSFGCLPTDLQDAIKDFEVYTGANAELLSLGAEPDQTIIV